MKTMNILCATDNNFVVPTFVTVYSIIANHKGVKVNFFILLNKDVTSENREKLTKFIRSKKCTVTFYEVDENSFSGYVVCEKFPKSAYYRLLAHTFLPKEIDRILYLDVDIVVDKNIYDDFYMMDFKDNYLIVTSHNPNPSFYNMLDPHLVNIESAARGEFFNSGVLLMNLDKFRKENITIEDYNRAYQFCEDRNIEVFYDQGLLNFMFFDKSIYLSSMDYNYRFSIPRDYARRLEKGREYKKAIIHFTGMKQPYKPWDLRLDEETINEFGEVPYRGDYFYISKELNDLCEIWWKYAEKTPVYDEAMYAVNIKNKWFKRNLKDFMIKHNQMVAKGPKESVKVVKQTEQVVKVEKKIEYRYPEGFKHRTYKIALGVTKPFFALRKIIKKKK